MWRQLDTWVATGAFHLNPAVVIHRPTGSTDTALDYIQNLCIVLIAIAVGVVWPILDRKRPNYDVLHSWLRLLTRYALAINLLTYGLVKVFQLQMGPVFGYKLLQPYGDISPMGVLWSFVGSAAPYQIFGGAAELTAGLLLVFPRTTTLGSLVSFGVLLNVVMLNLCYDVPVKLFSINLLIAAVFLAAPDLVKLTKFFVLSRSVDPLNSASPMFEKRWIRTAAAGFKCVFLSVYLFQNISGYYRSYRSFIAERPRPALAGLYEVETLVQDGSEVPPLATNSSRWRRLDLESPDSIQVQTMDESIQTYAARYSPDGERLTLSAPAFYNQLGPEPGLPPGTKEKFQFVLSRPDTDHVLMQGGLANGSLVIKMKRIDLSKFPLLNRGFHWIQESGFNP
ncbi:MAG TPA: hypothetical protein VH639_02515 [Bryobacteraceae bacterium]